MTFFICLFSCTCFILFKHENTWTEQSIFSYHICRYITLRYPFSKVKKTPWKTKRNIDKFSPKQFYLKQRNHRLWVFWNPNHFFLWIAKATSIGVSLMDVFKKVEKVSFVLTLNIDQKNFFQWVDRERCSALYLSFLTHFPFYTPW